MSLYAEFPGGGNSTSLRIDTVIDGKSPYSICLWVRAPSLASNIGLFSTTGFSSADTLVILSTGAVRIGAFVEGSGSQVDSSSGLVTADTWVHLAVVRSTAAKYELYVNGVVVATNTYDTTARAAWSGSNTASVICRNTFVTQSAYYAAELKLYGRSLSVGEVTKEMRHSAPTPGLIARYPLRTSLTMSGGGTGTGLSFYDPSPTYSSDLHPNVRVFPPGPLYWPPDGGGGGSGAISGTAAMAFTGSGTLTGSGELAGSTAVTFSGSGTGTLPGALVGSTSVALTGTGSLLGDGALAGSTTLAVAGTGALHGDGALVGVTTITFAGSGTTGSESALVGTSTLILTGTGELRGSGALAGAATVAFAGTGAIFDLGAGAITGTATMAFTGTGTMLGQVLSVQTVGTFGPVSIAAGSEWYITVSGPALDAPRMRITVS